MENLTLQCPVSQPENLLKVRADKANRDLAIKDEQMAKRQVEDFYIAMGPVADQGLYCGAYDGPLSALAIRILRKEGIQIDEREEVTTSWMVAWRLGLCLDTFPRL